MSYRNAYIGPVGQCTSTSCKTSFKVISFQVPSLGLGSRGCSRAGLQQLRDIVRSHQHILSNLNSTSKMFVPVRSCQQATRTSVRASCSPRHTPVAIVQPTKMKVQQVSSAAWSSVLAISLVLSGGGQAHAESLPAYQAYELLPKSFEKPAELAVYADSQVRVHSTFQAAKQPKYAQSFSWSFLVY